MLLMIDNYDSFTYNLVQYLRELGARVEVHRNDRITLDEVRAMQPERIVLSPGPCTPAEAGICCDLIRAFGSTTPLLGVCLGHQCIGAAYGGRILRAGRLMHGKTSPIQHDGCTLFAGLPNPFEATRYHSLLIERESLPDCLRISAETAVCQRTRLPMPSSTDRKRSRSRISAPFDSASAPATTRRAPPVPPRRLKAVSRGWRFAL